MNLYLISQTVNSGCDTYDSAVVCAASEDEARVTHPGGLSGRFDDWPWPGDVSVNLIGAAAPSVEPGVVIASFNAG